jgi:hypothetical protein
MRRERRTQRRLFFTAENAENAENCFFTAEIAKNAELVGGTARAITPLLARVC